MVNVFFFFFLQFLFIHFYLFYIESDFSTCASITSGWIRKEEYSNSNKFFELDIQNSYIDTDLKRILGYTMSAYHPDRLFVNLRRTDVKLRVGTKDMTTHPWYSRRLHRVLHTHGINSTLEEVLSTKKNHIHHNIHHNYILYMLAIVNLDILDSNFII